MDANLHSMEGITQNITAQFKVVFFFKRFLLDHFRYAIIRYVSHMSEMPQSFRHVTIC